MRVSSEGPGDGDVRQYRLVLADGAGGAAFLTLGLDEKEFPSGPPRHYYMLTPQGEAALAEFTEIWPHFRDAVDRFITD